MAERILKYAVPIWLCGRREVLYVYEEVDPRVPAGADVDEYFPARADGRRPAFGAWLAKGQHDKYQIVLHWTAANNPARNTLSYWSSKRWRCGSTAGCSGQVVRRAQPCPRCGKACVAETSSGAQYVLERTPASYGERAITPTGGRRQGDDYPDIVEAAPSYTSVCHANNARQSIGIEVANLGGRGGRGVELTPGNELMRARARAVVGQRMTFQAVQEEQFHALALLLRYLCMKHRIRRKFLGETLAEIFEHHPAGRALRTFRGLYGHLNTTRQESKVCGGVSYPRSRLFRLITDEWWMPVEIDGAERLYYMFSPPGSDPDAPRFVRWPAGADAPVVERLSDIGDEETLAAFHDTRSYYDPTLLDYYYAHTEVEAREGTFPIGRQEVWHGGVHLRAREQNERVYAAASGRIVAARVAPDPEEGPRAQGSTRFVLVRHYVHLPDREGRVAYRTGEGEPRGEDEWIEPTCVHTLYMHLGPLANPAGEDASNPPWFNDYLRAGGAAPGEGVFSPDQPVLVGDWLGSAARIGSSARAVHFEVLAKDRLDLGPFADAAVTFDGDSDGDMVCNDPKLTAFFDQAEIELPEGRVTIQAVLAGLREATPTLRHAKVWRTSEWALDLDAERGRAKALEPVLLRRHPWLAGRQSALEQRAAAAWEGWTPYMWVGAFREVAPEAAALLFDDQGRCWHYHPITFLAWINEAVRVANGPEREGAAGDEGDEVEQRPVAWESWIRQPTTASEVTLEESGRVLVSYPDAQAAAADAPGGVAPPAAGAGWFVLRERSTALHVRILERDGRRGVLGLYDTREEAEAEQENTRNVAWPVLADGRIDADELDEEERARGEELVAQG